MLRRWNNNETDENTQTGRFTRNVKSIRMATKFLLIYISEGLKNILATIWTMNTETTSSQHSTRYSILLRER